MKKTEVADALPQVPELTVYYDGACPLCRTEIAYYQGRDHEQRIAWVDAAQCDSSALGPGLSRQDALGRFHVRDLSGELRSGGRAFSAVWCALPGFRWLGRITGTTFAGVLTEWLYRGFLRIRPAVQWVHRKWTRGVPRPES